MTSRMESRLQKSQPLLLQKHPHIWGNVVPPDVSASALRRRPRRGLTRKPGQKELDSQLEVCFSSSRLKCRQSADVLQ